jgi:hypothetical protein
MAINWQYIGHVAVGTIVTACQAIALSTTDPKTVNVCHIISLVAIQLGVSFGVWQVSQVMQMRSTMERLSLGTPPSHGAENPDK